MSQAGDPLVHALVGEGTAVRIACEAPRALYAVYQRNRVTCPACLACLPRQRPAAPPCLFPDEAHFQAALMDVARTCGWDAFHVWTSQHSEAGYPDTTLIRATELLAFELKMPGKAPTAAQQRWIDAFTRVQTVEARVVWPDDWDWLIARLQPH